MMVIKFIWQLPQNILGLLVILLTGSKKHPAVLAGSQWHTYYRAKRTGRYGWGVSLGNFIIFSYGPDRTSILHEYGHQRQSLRLGPLYLLIIGLPSLCGNIYARIKHLDSWWYYHQPWEAWADRLGGVVR